jgi:hypothetical protein
MIFASIALFDIFSIAVYVNLWTPEVSEVMMDGQLTTESK